MEVTYINGDAVGYTLDHDDTVILHVCNNLAVMDDGISHQIKNKIPTAFENYFHKSMETDNPDERLGHISFSSELNVCNMTCQNGIGFGKRNIHYGYLVDCLNKLVWFLNNTHKTVKQVVIPKSMELYRAGGDWETVLELVSHALKNTKIDQLVVVQFSITHE